MAMLEQATVALLTLGHQPFDPFAQLQLPDSLAERHQTSRQCESEFGAGGLVKQNVDGLV